MKKEPIHQNLNTSFVNLAALVRYLRGLQFVGSIRVELSSYEADIIFTNSQTIIAREYDHIAGRISHGQKALQRILVRAKEPHGRIHVYKSFDGNAGRQVFVDKSIVTSARLMAASHGGTRSRGGSHEFFLSGADGKNSILLGALSELLRIIDESLADGKLSFTAAFNNACAAIAGDFPFMIASKKAIVYEDGEIRVTAQAEASHVASAVFAALRPIFLRLKNEEKYSHLFHLTRNKLQESIAAKRAEYIRIGLMSHIESLLNDVE